MRRLFRFRILVVILLVAGGVFYVLRSQRTAEKNDPSQKWILGDKQTDGSGKALDQKNSLPAVKPKPEPSFFDPIVPSDISVPVLMYHHIASCPDGDSSLCSLFVTPADFNAQMSYLKLLGYNVISLDDLALGLAGRKTLPQKPIAITFDDGYKDTYESAFLVLRRFGFAATFFIISGRVSQPGYLTWRDLRQMAEAGYTIGAHTVSHPQLTSTVINLAEKEIIKSKDDLEFGLNTKVRYFAYPGGSYNKNLFSALGEGNYAAAFTTEGGPVTSSVGSYYELPRIRVDGRYSGELGIKHFISLLKW